MSQPVTVDLTGRLDLPGEVWAETWLFAPERSDGPPPRAVLFGFPGASYSKRYFHFELAPHTGYSMAEYLSGQGFVFVACDNLGVGGSARPRGELLSLGLMAEANHHLVEGVMRQIRSGGLGFTVADTAPIVGLGHSSGGGIVTLQQARHRTFHGLVILGHSALKPHFTPPPGAPPRREGIPAESAISADGYVLSPRDETQNYIFFGDNVPRAIVEADAAIAEPTPPCFYTEDGGMYGGATSRYAREVEVPILLAFAERDSAREPHAEPSAYPRSSDVTLYLQPDSAHCANFAPTRAQLFSRVARWVDGTPL